MSAPRPPAARRPRRGPAQGWRPSRDTVLSVRAANRREDIQKEANWEVTVAGKKRPFRADHVGSLLRPKPLLDARAKRDAGDLGEAGLRSVEDEAIKGVVAFQEDVGLQGVT